MIKMKNSLAILMLTFISICTTAQKGKPLFKAKFGVQSYTFRKSFPKNILATLDTIKAMGFTEIEGGNPKGMSPDEFRKACDERGISIPSTGGGYEQLVKNPMEAVNKAKIFGSKYIMCAWIPHKSLFNIDDAKKAVEDFNTIGKIFSENGLIFCYHDHGYEFQKYEDGTLMDYIIKNTDPKYVSFEMDVLWTLHGGGDPVSLLKKYGDRWKLMHVKDLKKGVIGNFTGNTPAENDVVLGEGQADWKGIFKQANKIGIKHFFIEDESDNEYVNIPKSLAFLKNLR
jgi:sugar phosphate isomerase/epimerase